MISMQEVIQSSTEISNLFTAYLSDESKSPLFILGDALSTLRVLPSESIDFCMTSPPYWNKRQYNSGGIGLEDDYKEYISNLLEIFREVKRVLKTIYWTQTFGQAKRPP